MYYTISGFCGINDVEEVKVQSILESIITNGWKGAPILYVDDYGLVTGSHRLEALKRLEAMYDDADNATQSRIDEILNSDDIALDVSGIIDEYCAENDCTFDQIQFDNLRTVFAGTEIEKYAAEIAEW